jgi:hypothetical protein
VIVGGKTYYVVYRFKQPRGGLSQDEKQEIQEWAEKTLALKPG